MLKTPIKRTEISRGQQSSIYVAKKFICEHNNGFINKQKNGFYLQRRKRISHFVLKMHPNGYPIPRLTRGSTRTLWGVYSMPSHIALTTSTNLSAWLAASSAFSFAQLHWQLPHEALELTCVADDCTGQRVSKTTSWGLEGVHGVLCWLGLLHKAE